MHIAFSLHYLVSKWSHCVDLVHLSVPTFLLHYLSCTTCQPVSLLSFLFLSWFGPHLVHASQKHVEFLAFHLKYLSEQFCHGLSCDLFGMCHSQHLDYISLEMRLSTSTSYRVLIPNAWNGDYLVICFYGSPFKLLVFKTSFSKLMAAYRVRNLWSTSESFFKIFLYNMQCRLTFAVINTHYTSQQCDKYIVWTKSCTLFMMMGYR